MLHEVCAPDGQSPPGEIYSTALRSKQKQINKKNHTVRVSYIPNQMLKMSAAILSW